MRFHSCQHAVEVVGIHLDKFAILQSGQGFHGLAREITQYSHNERELFQFDRATDLHVISDVHSRRSHSIKLMLCALSCHSENPPYPTNPALAPVVSVHERSKCNRKGANNFVGNLDQMDAAMKSDFNWGIMAASRNAHES